MTYSQLFSNAIWTKDNSTVTSGFTSPSGAADAFKLIESATTAVHNIYISFLSLTLGNYTTSIYIKKGERFKVAVADRNSGLYVSYNLNTGTIIDSLSLVGTIESLDNDWYRLTATTTTSVSVYVPQFFILQDSYTTGIPITLPYLGDGTSGIYIWGTQLEAGSYATSYIPTTSAAVTRNDDEISKTGISALIGQTEGTIFIDFDIDNILSQTIDPVIFSCTGTNYIRLFTTGVISYFESNAVSLSSSSSIINNGQNKIAVNYKNNDFSIYANGVLVATNNSGAVVAKSQISLNYIASTIYNPSIFYNLVTLFPTKLTGAECISLTT
jgi:hypothetical protein